MWETSRKTRVNTKRSVALGSPMIFVFFASLYRAVAFVGNMHNLRLLLAAKNEDFALAMWQ